MIVTFLFLTCFTVALLPEAKTAALENSPQVPGIPKVACPEKAKQLEVIRQEAQKQVDMGKKQYDELQQGTQQRIEESKKAFERQQQELVEQMEQGKIQVEEVLKNLKEQVTQEKKNLEEEHQRVREQQELEKKQLDEQHNDQFNQLESWRQQIQKQHEELLKDLAEDRKRLDEEHAQMVAELERDRKEQEEREKEIWNEVEQRIKETETMWGEQSQEKRQETYQRLLERGPRGCKRVKNIRDRSKYPRIDTDEWTIILDGQEIVPNIQNKYETYECQDDRYGNFYKLTTNGFITYGMNDWNDGDTKKTVYYLSDWSHFDWEPDMSKVKDESRRSGERRRRGQRRPKSPTK